jgi:hypothetical protein
VDGSTGARTALVYAWTAAAARDAELEIVGTYAVDAGFLVLDVYDPSLADTLRAHTEETVSRQVGEVRRDPAVAAVPGLAEVSIRTVVTARPTAQDW